AVDRPSLGSGQDTRRLAHSRLRPAQHPDRVPEHPRLVHEHQDRPAVREPDVSEEAPPPAGQHLSDLRARLEGVPEPRERRQRDALPGPASRLQVVKANPATIRRRRLMVALAAGVLAIAVLVAALSAGGTPRPPAPGVAAAARS